MSPEQYAIYRAGILARKQEPPREPLVRKATPEAELHDAILAECRRRGLCFIHSRMDRASTIQVGAPDFVIALPAGRTLWIECKSAKGVLRQAQAAFLATLQSLGHEAQVVRSLDQFLSLICPDSRP